MSNWGSENASQRKSYVGVVYDKGEKLVKKEILDSLPKEWADLHNQGYIHIHDLDAYGLTYNCLTFNILNRFPYNEYKNLTDSRKIMKLFDYYKDIIVKVGNEQSGGMAFANFDCDTATILDTIHVVANDTNLTLIKDQINSFINWCNNSHERMGEVSYYVSLNIGLAENNLARKICEILLDEFYESSVKTIKPNIIFKVKHGINANILDINYYLYEKATLCTAKKMIPTYLLCDCESDKPFSPYKLAIMGCRTRVVADQFGESTSIGRGNIDNITINLPRLALETISETKMNTIDVFKNKWLSVAEIVKDILIDRYNRLIKLTFKDFPTNYSHNLWSVDFDNSNSLEEVFKHGTLSIGFIGLSETIEILSGQKYYLSEEAYKMSKDIVLFMRSYIDKLKEKYNMNFSLLATSGEFISGRFPSIDSQIYHTQIAEKGYYTNSFHIDVDSKLTAFEKIRKEGYFHNLCNGGCITYVELKSSPIGNSEGIMELISAAENAGVHYLGINFPLDICNDCLAKGVFDTCENCGSKNITRIRRVSGYLEVLDYFTAGKKAEVKNRKENR